MILLRSILRLAYLPERRPHFRTARFGIPGRISVSTGAGVVTADLSKALEGCREDAAAR